MKVILIAYLLNPAQYFTELISTKKKKTGKKLYITHCQDLDVVSYLEILLQVEIAFNFHECKALQKSNKSTK